MAVSESTLSVSLPQKLAAELEQLARETGRSKSYYARQAIIEFLEDRADYLRAVATLEKQEPRLTLAGGEEGSWPGGLNLGRMRSVS